MKSKALILTVFTALAIQAPIYACGKKKGVSKAEHKQSRTLKQKRKRQKRKLTQRLKRIKRRLVALDKKENS